ncbi:MAG: transposase [Nitrososphaerota archaeon]|nr:transposase [Nitrososphaerota archaeon]
MESLLLFEARSKKNMIRSDKKKTSKTVKSIARTMTNKTSCGIDLADEVSVATMFSRVGDLLERFSFTTDWTGFSKTFAEKVPRDSRIGFEACLMAYPVSRTLRELGYDDITVAHPRELMWITKSKKKNDKVDSEKIARLLMANMLPESHLLSKEEQIEIDLLIQRVRLGEQMRRVKTSITSYLKREDLFRTLPDTYENWSVVRRKAIEEIRFGDDRDLQMSA